MIAAEIEYIDACPIDDFRRHVGPLFEDAPAFVDRLAHARPFGSVDRLFEVAFEIAETMPEREKIELLNAHPRLGAPPGSVSATSFIEQGYDRDAADDLAEKTRARVDADLTDLNDAYESTFGFRYCTFVAGRSRAELIPGLRAALRADRESELRRGLREVIEIARDRWLRSAAEQVPAQEMARREVATRAGSPIELGPNRYGKSAIRLVRVDRSVESHRVYDLTLDIALDGDFAAAHVEGDNAAVIATDTMKNTAYAFAREHLRGSIEAYGEALASHFLGAEQVSGATITIQAARWAAIGDRRDAFARDGSYTRTARICATGGGVSVDAGVTDLTVLKTTRSAFVGFPRDRYTTLPEAPDRMMATKLTATWRYSRDDVDFDGCHASILATLLETFADHDSRSVQHSIWLMGRAVLERHAEVDEISMSLPNLHHWLVDLAPFGQDNPGEVFVATREPHGLIEATVRRSDARRG